MGIAGVMASIIAIKGAAWGLGVGIILVLLLLGNFSSSGNIVADEN